MADKAKRAAAQMQVFSKARPGVAVGPGPAPMARRAVGHRLATAALIRALMADRPRWGLWLAVAYAAGIAVYFSMPVEPPLAFAVGALVPAGALVVAAGGRELPRWMAATVLAAALGFTVATLRTAALDTAMLTRALWADVDGRVVRIEMRPADVRLTLAEVRLSAAHPMARPPDRIRVVLRSKTDLPGLGARVRVRARLSPPPAPSVPGGFDFQRRAYFDGLGAVGFAVGAVEVIELASPAPRTLVVDRLRAAIADRLAKALPGPPGALAAALLVGERAGLDEETRNAFRDSGLAHLLAISGLHMGLVAGAVFATVRFLLCLVPGLALRRPVKKIAAGVALASGAVYLLLDGAPVPTQRAFLMTGVVLLGVLLDREAVTLRLVALAAVAVLTLRPDALAGPSFQLSFAAVIALVACYEGWRSSAMARDRRGGVAGILRRGGTYIAGVALTSLVASVATAPIVTYHFQSVALGGLAANLLAVPLTAFVTMPAGILALLAMPFGLEAPAVATMGAGLDGTLAVARWTVTVTGPAVSVPPLPVCGLSAITVGGCWIAIWRTGLRWLGAVPIGVGAAVWLASAPPDVLISADARLAAIDAGERAGWVVSTTRGHRFTRSVWARRWDVSAPIAITAFDGTGLGAESGLACDDLGCTLRRRGRRLALIASHEAALEDCAEADVVIALVKLRTPCLPRDLLVHRPDIRRSGAHAVWLRADGARVETVADRRGDRPWVSRQ
jgi:competence protein ComEC